MFALIYMYMLFEENSRKPYTFAEIWPVGLGSFLMVSALILGNSAMIHGKAGPT